MPLPTPAAPFHSAEAAWFSAARVLDGAARPGRQAGQGIAGSQAEGVVRCLDRLYRNRRIELLHARILHIWGRRGVAPNPARPRERSDWHIWREALDRMDGPLRAQGIVGHLGPAE